mmetsp:Transcript_11523/g.28201  ORF Transcript_11523/g.28201 Transcript_11523/m.28201 type:complete len:222 (-) Transcript_11523:1479-2144(-)
MQPLQHPRRPRGVQRPARSPCARTRPRHGRSRSGRSSGRSLGYCRRRRCLSCGDLRLHLGALQRGRHKRAHAVDRRPGSASHRGHQVGDRRVAVNTRLVGCLEHLGQRRQRRRRAVQQPVRRPQGREAGQRQRVRGGGHRAQQRPGVGRAWPQVQRGKRQARCQPGTGQARELLVQAQVQLVVCQLLLLSSCSGLRTCPCCSCCSRSRFAGGARTSSALWL